MESLSKLCFENSNLRHYNESVDQDNERLALKTYVVPWKGDIDVEVTVDGDSEVPVRDVRVCVTPPWPILSTCGRDAMATTGGSCDWSTLCN